MFIDTKCRYHAQDHADFCGPAAAMMILAQQGVNVSTLDQSTMYSILRASSGSGVATLPAALVGILNVSFSGRFGLTPGGAASGAARRVLQSLLKNVPAAVPVYEDSHWTVTKAMTTDVDPASGQPYNILRVWMHNPSPGAGTPPHSSTDVCGLAGYPGIKEGGYDYREWLSYISLPGELFKYQCVVGTQLVDIPESLAPPPLPPALPGFDSAGAEDVVQYHLDSEVLERLAPSGEIQARSVGLVHSLAEGIADYYLVAISDVRGYIGLACIDAGRPWLRSIGILGSPQEKIFPETEEVVHSLMDSELPGESNGALALDLLNTRLKEARLVWRPCQESPVPFTPFLFVPLGGNLDSESHAFVRFTERPAVFLELTRPLQGG